MLAALVILKKFSISGATQEKCFPILSCIPRCEQGEHVVNCSMLLTIIDVYMYRLEKIFRHRGIVIIAEISILIVAVFKSKF